jgi:anti-sigma factor RsiW
MNDPLYNSLRESSWRRKLSVAEEAELRAWLAAHPEAQADWEAETGLTAALGRLPDAPVPSNFTARVLQAVERETPAAETRPAAWRWWTQLSPARWLARLGFAVIVLGAGLISYHETRVVQRNKIAHGLKLVTEVSPMPSPEILQDFDAIRVLNQTPAADVQLLTLLQ